MLHLNSDLISLLLVGAGGVALGALFFGGLWLTLRLSLDARQPALWIFVSLLLRMTMALDGLYLLASGDWQRMLAALGGFLLARLLVTLFTRPSPEKAATPKSAGEYRHAP